MPAGDDSPFADTVTLEQKTSTIGGTSGKVSLWMQWMLPKVTVKVFAPDPASKKTGIPSFTSNYQYMSSCLLIIFFLFICIQIYVERVNDLRL